MNEIDVLLKSPTERVAQLEKDKAILNLQLSKSQDQVKELRTQVEQLTNAAANNEQEGEI